MRLRSAPVIAITLVTATTVVLGFAPANDQRQARPSAPPVGLGGGGPLEGGTGACCSPEGICVVTNPTVCANVGGSYQGNGTVCNPDCLMTIANGPDPNALGYLAISPDPYGAWFPTGTSVPTDELYHNFNNPSPLTAAFSAGTYFFSGGTARELLATDNFGGSVPNDASMTKMVTAGLALSDTDGDLVDDTATSSFNLTGVAGDLDIDLTQWLADLNNGGWVVLTQDYTVTNNLPTPIDFTLVRVYDGDLLWSGDFANDNVETLTNGSLGERFVSIHEPSGTSAGIVLSSPQGNAYVGGKRGVDPDGAGGSPPYNYGTGPEYWNAYGVPTGWRNHIAGAGYNTNGGSRNAPPGSTPPEDAHVALEIPVSLAGNATTTVTVRHSYTPNVNQVPPGACCVPEFQNCFDNFSADNCASLGGTFRGSVTECPPPCPWDCAGCDGAVNVSDLLKVLSEYDTSNPPCDGGGDCDFDFSGCVDVGDLLKVLAHYDPSGVGCP